MPDMPDAPPLVFTRKTVREVDRRCIEDFGIPGIVLMENAASALADAALALIATRRCDCACILAGPGNNGGDGFALARKLSNARVPVAIAILADPDRITGDARTNYDIARCLALRIEHIPPDDLTAQLDALTRSLGDKPLLVDAMLGTGLTAVVRGPIAEAIDWINANDSPTLAVDLPSGLDCDTGQPLGDAVRAIATVTFVGWKRGFLTKGVKEYTGEIIVGDIGAPIELVHELGQPQR